MSSISSKHTPPAEARALKMIRQAYAKKAYVFFETNKYDCLLYTSPSPRDRTRSRMPSSA